MHRLRTTASASWIRDGGEHRKNILPSMYSLTVLLPKSFSSSFTGISPLLTRGAGGATYRTGIGLSTTTTSVVTSPLSSSAGDVALLHLVEVLLTIASAKSTMQIDTAAAPRINWSELASAPAASTVVAHVAAIVATMFAALGGQCIAEEPSREGTFPCGAAMRAPSGSSVATSASLSADVIPSPSNGEKPSFPDAEDCLSFHL